MFYPTYHLSSFFLHHCSFRVPTPLSLHQWVFIKFLPLFISTIKIMVVWCFVTLSCNAFWRVNKAGWKYNVQILSKMEEHLSNITFVSLHIVFISAKQISRSPILTCFFFSKIWLFVFWLRSACLVVFLAKLLGSLKVMPHFIIYLHNCNHYLFSSDLQINRPDRV